MPISLRNLVRITAWKAPFAIFKVALISLLFGDSVFGSYVFITSASLTISIVLSMRQEVIIHSQDGTDLHNTNAARILLQLIAISCIFFALQRFIKSPPTLFAMLIVSSSLTLEDFAKSISDRYGYTLEYEKKIVFFNCILPPLLYLALFWFIHGNVQLRLGEELLTAFIAISEFSLIAMVNTLYLSKASFFDTFLLKEGLKMCSTAFSNTKQSISTIYQHLAAYRAVYIINYPSAVLSSIFGLGSAFWIIEIYGADQLGRYSLLNKILGFLPLFIAVNMNRKLFIEGMSVRRSGNKSLIASLYRSTFKKSALILGSITFATISLYFLGKLFFDALASSGASLNKFLESLDLLNAPPNLIILICITILFASITKSISRFAIVGREDLGLIINLLNSLIPFIIYFLANYFSLGFDSAVFLQLLLIIATLCLQVVLIKHSLNVTQVSSEASLDL